MIGVKQDQVIHRGLKVRLDEVRSSDRGFRVDLTRSNSKFCELLYSKYCFQRGARGSIG